VDDRPKRFKLPTGESLADATRMTAIKCHSLFRRVDCDELKSAVVDAMVRRQSVFSGDYSKAYARWAMGFVEA
jgi:hypothetical protein